MRAVVLCAGYGTRLAPITDRVPKPLVPVANRAVLDIVLDRIAQAGIGHVGINLHHKAEQIAQHLAQRNEGPRVHTVREPEILDTGGGIAHFGEWDEPLLVHNADIVTDIDIAAVVRVHEESGADVTMALVDDARFNAIRVTDDGRVAGIRGEGPERRYTLSGVYALSRRFLERLVPHQKHSVIDAVRAQIEADPESVRAYLAGPRTYWRDLGHVPSYLALHREVLLGHAPPLPGVTVPTDGVLVSPDARVDESARLDGFVAIGPGCVVGRGVHLTDCVVLAGTALADGFTATGAVILDDILLAA